MNVSYAIRNLEPRGLLMITEEHIQVSVVVFMLIFVFVCLGMR